MRKFNHVGIPTTTPKEGEFYVEGMKVWLTDFSKSENKIEWLRFEPGSWLPELVQTQTHMAWEVPSLAEAIKGKKVLVEPCQGGENLMIAFIEEEGIAVELMEFTK